MAKSIISILLLVTSSVFPSQSSMSMSLLWRKAKCQTIREQNFEDVNVLYRHHNYLVRQLLVMPLTELCNPSEHNSMHGKVNHGDKCCFPPSIGKTLYEKPFDVPWIFEMKSVNSSLKRESITLHDVAVNISKLYVSPLDFRAPENYIFIPQWMMETLNLKPNDSVFVSYIVMKLARIVTLQPLSLNWDTLISSSSDIQSILEHEVNKYSALASNTVISINYRGLEYSFYVKDTKTDNDVSVDAVRIQDSDVKVDIDRSILDLKLKIEEKNAMRKAKI